MQHNMDVVSFQKEKENDQRTSFLLTGKYIHPTVHLPDSDSSTTGAVELAGRPKTSSRTQPNRLNAHLNSVNVPPQISCIRKDMQ
jgi:hypothetical protein